MVIPLSGSGQANPSPSAARGRREGERASQRGLRRRCAAAAWRPGLPPGSSARGLLDRARSQTRQAAPHPVQRDTPTMKKLLALLAFLPAAPAFAQTMTAAPQVDVGNIPPGLPQLTSCSSRLDTLLVDLQTKNISSANAVLMIGETALAESPSLPSSGGFNPIGGTATKSGNKIAGSSKVAVPGTNTSSALTYTLSNVDGTARLTWVYKGKSYASSVDSCSSGYWTAASATSAIVVKLGALQSPPK